MYSGLFYNLESLSWRMFHEHGILWSVSYMASRSVQLLGGAVQLLYSCWLGI